MATIAIDSVLNQEQNLGTHAVSTHKRAHKHAATDRQTDRKTHMHASTHTRTHTHAYNYYLKIDFTECSLHVRTQYVFKQFKSILSILNIQA